MHRRRRAAGGRDEHAEGSMAQIHETEADRTLELTCVADVPLTALFDAWTRPDSMMRWWAPREFTMQSAAMDPRVGGRWSVCMRAPQGTDHIEGGIVREFERNRRLVMTHAWQTAVATPGYETLITVEFGERDGKAQFAFRQGTFESKRSRDMHDEGWLSALSLLAEHLGTQLGSVSLGRPGAAGELLRHARPMFEIIRAYVTAQTRTNADDAPADSTESKPAR
jgi:uncharacterized protein YndB with AHSA1/START domain